MFDDLLEKYDGKVDWTCPIKEQSSGKTFVEYTLKVTQQEIKRKKMFDYDAEVIKFYFNNKLKNELTF